MQSRGCGKREQQGTCSWRSQPHHGRGQKASQPPRESPAVWQTADAMNQGERAFGDRGTDTLLLLTSNLGLRSHQLPVAELLGSKGFITATTGPNLTCHGAFLLHFHFGQFEQWIREQVPGSSPACSHATSDISGEQSCSSRSRKHPSPPGALQCVL